MAKCVTTGSLKVLIQESITLPNKNEEICINEVTIPGVAQTVRAEGLQLMPIIKQQSVDAMIDAKERGGKVADVFK